MISPFCPRPRCGMDGSGEQSRSAKPRKYNTMSKYIDTRELNDRLEELADLESALDAAREALDDLNADASKEEREEAESALDAARLDFGDDEEKELASLRDL